MKKIFIISLSFLLFPGVLGAYTQHNLESANFLAMQGIINDNSLNPIAYNLDSSITRREMLKVMMNLSGNTISESCEGKFSDMNGQDWGCKYAEAALSAGYIAQNKQFRPDDNVTQIEALKMIMQSKNIQQEQTQDWREGYVKTAYSEGLINENYLEYNENALRGWIFSSSAKSFSSFNYTSPEVDLDPEIEKLFQELLNL